MSPKEQIEAMKVQAAAAGGRLTKLEIPYDMYEILQAECGSRDPSEVLGVLISIKPEEGPSSDYGPVTLH